NRYGTDYYSEAFPGNETKPITWGAIWEGESLYSFFTPIPADNTPHTVSREFDFDDVAGKTIHLEFANGDEESYGSITIPETTEEDLVYNMELDPLPAPLVE